MTLLSAEPIRSKSVAGHRTSAERRVRFRQNRWKQNVTKLRALLSSTKASPQPAKPIAMDYATWARRHNIHGNIGGGPSK